MAFELTEPDDADPRLSEAVASTSSQVQWVNRARALAQSAQDRRDQWRWRREQLAQERAEQGDLFDGS